MRGIKTLFLSAVAVLTVSCCAPEAPKVTTLEIRPLARLVFQESDRSNSGDYYIKYTLFWVDPETRLVKVKTVYGTETTLAVYSDVPKGEDAWAKIVYTGDPADRHYTTEIHIRRVEDFQAK
jgi:hypothetical protein